MDAGAQRSADRTLAGAVELQLERLRRRLEGAHVEECGVTLRGLPGSNLLSW